MPLYEYECSDGHVTEQYFYKALSLRTIKCEACGMKAVRVMSVPKRDLVGKPYYDEHLGETITSYSQRSRLMKEKGLLEKAKSDMSASKG